MITIKKEVKFRTIAEAIAEIFSLGRDSIFDDAGYGMYNWEMGSQTILGEEIDNCILQCYCVNGDDDCNYGEIHFVCYKDGNEREILWDDIPLFMQEILLEKLVEHFNTNNQHPIEINF